MSTSIHSAKPIVGLVASGAMGSAVAHRLVANGYTVLTCLKGRSEDSIRRAIKAGMQDVDINKMVENSQYIFSILPPSNAISFADQVLSCLTESLGESEPLTFVDCNAISPAAVAQLSSKFSQHNLNSQQHRSTRTVRFADASIIGGPPSLPNSERVYDPTFYISGDDNALVEEVAVVMRNGGLKVTTLENAGVGEASALKMGYAGINKGLTGLITAMILATYQSSPATAKALMTELASSQPALLQRTVRMIPDMLPKAYRFVGEMHEISDFTSSSLSSLDETNGETAGSTWRGLASLYELVSTSLKTDGDAHKILEEFVKDAKELLNVNAQSK